MVQKLYGVHNSKNNQTDYCRTLAEETSCNQASIANFNFIVILSICLKFTPGALVRHH